MHFVEWFGENDILLIIDELNNLTSLDDENRKEEAKSFCEFLKSHFLSKEGRYFVFSSHLISTLSDFSDILQVSQDSIRGVTLWELPLVPDLSTATKKLYNHLDGAREALYFGLLPGLIHLRSKRSVVEGSRQTRVQQFLDENGNNLKAGFIQICCSLVTGNREDVPKSLQSLCDGCSFGLEECKVRWVPYHLEYVLSRMLMVLNPSDSLLADAMRSMLQQLARSKEKSGEGWECMFVLFLLARCISRLGNALFLPKEWFEGRASITVHYNCAKTLAYCRTSDDLMKGIAATSEPSISILYPTHAQLEAYDVFAVLFENKSIVQAYGYQLKEGKVMSNRPAAKFLSKSFVVKGVANKKAKINNGWSFPSKGDINTFFGPCGSHWTPQVWDAFVQMETC
jgi:hypothetical protein